MGITLRTAASPQFLFVKKQQQAGDGQQDGKGSGCHSDQNKERGRSESYSDDQCSKGKIRIAENRVKKG